MKHLRVIAGPTALSHIRDHGLKQADFKAVVAASGGPKWFVLKCLDQYLFGDFFAGRQTPLHTMGSSAGAWQMACFAQDNPAAAIERLADLYSRETYSAKPSPQEISGQARVLVKHLLGEQGPQHIVDNTVLQTHILTNRCKGPTASEVRWRQLGGMAAAAAVNAVSRPGLRYFIERVVFHSGSESFFRFSDFPTSDVRLTVDNVEDALMASGSIPILLAGVRDIAGAPPGVYRDGGLLDYHFDVDFLHGESEGLVLYPHFSSMITPGWFDKSLRYRKALVRHYDRVVILAPSDEFVASLPFGKIPDRNDFVELDPEPRLRYWQEVMSASAGMAEDFAALCEDSSAHAKIEPFSNRRR